ncbi:MAG TPA: NAD(P)/FAD-dependent oxidoreductase [Egibacteraceae bacterium]|nr:NAD(P)/FAD-dependent oxidoreductase [Egibacteraceae bacterium]
MIEHFRIAIVGSGFAGLGLAIQLKRSGRDDFVVLERGDDVGGTWRDNTYPGAACDVPSLLYSFSFAPNPGWSRSFSPQEEIQDYLRDCADRFGVRPHIRFGNRVDEARWDDEAQLWRIRTSAGELTAQFLMGGMGGLSEPSVPDLPGLERFGGTTFHSARWDHGYGLRGKRVAVVGTGASSIQFVPEIQPLVERLDVYQRTPAWIVPRWDRDLTRVERALYRRFPALQRLVRALIYWGREFYAIPFMHHRKRFTSPPERVARRHLRKQVPDPDLRAKLTPDYAAGCKRILISNDWYPALGKPNVDLVTAGIAEVTETGVVDRDGVERPVDAIIFGTGFHVTDFPHGRYIFGRDGRALTEHWREGAQAYLGMAAPGFPNFFFLTGPNTGLGHTSMVFMMECQFAYLLDMLGVVEERGIATVEVRPDVVAAFNTRLHERMPQTVWSSGGCASWYLDEHGRNTTLWPDFTWKFRLRTRRFSPADYDLGRRRVRVPAA